MEGPKADRVAIRKFCYRFGPFQDQCGCAKLCILPLKSPSSTIHHQQGPMLPVKEYFVFLTLQRFSPKYTAHPRQADELICVLTRLNLIRETCTGRPFDLQRWQTLSKGSQNFNTNWLFQNKKQQDLTFHDHVEIKVTVMFTSNHYITTFCENEILEENWPFWNKLQTMTITMTYSFLSTMLSAKMVLHLVAVCITSQKPSKHMLKVCRKFF